MNNTAEDRNLSQKKSYIVARLNELREFFLGSKTEEPQDIFKDNPYLEKLLAHAPTYYLDSKSNQELAALGKDLKILLEDLKRTKSGYLIKKSSDGTGVFIVTTDRPFIVSSLSECCRALQVQLQALLHPIIELDGHLYSISFMVVNQVTDELLESLNHMMELLVASTDDYSAMVSTVKQTAQEARNDNFSAKYAKSENQETAEFLEWLMDDSFILMGVLKHEIINQRIGKAIVNQGITRSANNLTRLLAKEIEEDLESFINLDEPIWLTKFREPSPIHRRVRLSHIQVASCDLSGNLIAIVSLIGIFSSKGSSEEGNNIPLIRTKLEDLLKEADVVRGSHDYKSIADTLGRMPKEEAIRLSREGLMSLIDQTVDVTTQLDPKVSVRFDASKRGASILVMLPQGRYSEEVRDDIARCIYQFFQVPEEDTESYVDASSHTVTRLYYHVAFSFCPTEKFDIQSLTEEIKTVSEDFGDRLLAYMRSRNELTQDSAEYAKAFDLRYRTSHSAEQAIKHIEVFRSLNDQKNVYVTHGISTRKKSSDQLEIITRNKELRLSDFLPVLESAGFIVLTDYTYKITIDEDHFYTIHQVAVETKNGRSIPNDFFDNAVKPALEEILQGEAEYDVLTSLALHTGLNNRQIQLMRGLCSYIWQIGSFTRKHQIREALADNADAALILWKFFDVRFNPNIIGERSSSESLLITQYQDAIRLEKDINKDRILRALMMASQNILRTNYYQNSTEIAIKIDCSGIDFMVEPKPWREIFVHSFDVEGVHLRTGPVARGGLRWSERPDDFRTEVLGLVKTQKVKNVFIVPEGAKGGFIVRRMPADNALLPEAVRNTYIKFIRALISLADNQVGAKIVPPQNVIRHDQDDPYFVVAADKGTATFSDTANNIAVNETGFWLDDAFASGGSNGYDHKVYGITAKGGWECVLRHFNDLGINYLTDTFTAVGIGDMAGDVFGNGLLLSDNVRLIAAFNHQHIFLDPNPDAKKSFAERKRMFDLPRSKWSDYSKLALSEGGDIVDRWAKEITLSPQMCGALGISSDKSVVSGEVLVQLILKAPVDLLWNGGIGTYIKASSETHAQVNDSGNDRVRVSASELRCKVIGEGGNLGLTQAARIEFSSLGGRLNTDAVDNSAGVGLSDKEVNLKLLFAGLIANGKITREQRNTFLKEMANEACEQVLSHNRAHAYRLTMSSQRSVIQHEFFRGFISAMEQKGYLNRLLDGLPQDDEIYRRLTVKNGLYRPELAVCMAATKMWIKKLLLDSVIIESKVLEPFLVSYFPTVLREQFLKEILNHPLRKTIIATQATNLIVDVLGISFFYRLTKNGNLDPDTALKACLAALLATNLNSNLEAIRKLDKPGTSESYLDVRAKYEQQLRSLANWFSINGAAVDSLDVLVPRYQALINAGLKANFFIQRPARDENIPSELPENIRLELRGLTRVAQSLEILSLAVEKQIAVDEALVLMKAVKDALNISGREYLKDSIQPINRWEYALRMQSLSDIDKALVGMVRFAINNGIKNPEVLEEQIKTSPSYDPVVQSINELTNISPSVAHLAVIARQLTDFIL